MNKLTPIFIAGALVISAGLAFAENQMDMPEPAAGHGGHTMSPAPASDNPATQAYQAANNKMHGDMAVEFTGDADIDFLRSMIPHHQGAIDMAKVVIEYGEDPEIRALAEGIIAAQEAEIAQMEAWLAARGQ